MHPSFFSQLFRGRPGGSSTHVASRRSSFGSDDLESVSASDPGGVVVSPEELSELNSRLEKIQKQLEQQRETDDKYVWLKPENAVLREKLNLLEEQMLVSDFLMSGFCLGAGYRQDAQTRHGQKDSGPPPVPSAFGLEMIFF